MRQWLFPLLLLLPGTGRADAAFTAAQRAEIIGIVRDALKTDPSILRDAVEALRQDEAAKQAAASTQAIAANRGEILGNPHDPVLGNPQGSLVFAEFFDVRCPYCRKMRPIVDAMLSKNPNVRLIMKDLPVLGPPSTLGAEALLAAQRQGGYQPMLEALMREGVQIDEPTIRQAATQAKLDWPRLKADMQDPSIQLRINHNREVAALLGIQGTPAFVINGQLVSGAMTPEALQQLIGALKPG